MSNHAKQPPHPSGTGNGKVPRGLTPRHRRPDDGPGSPADRAAQQHRLRVVTAVLVAASLVVIATTIVIQQWLRTRAIQAQNGTAAQLTPPNANPDGPGLLYAPGTADPAMPLVAVYLDYQCGGCIEVSRTVDPMLETLAEDGQIRLAHVLLLGQDRDRPNGLSFRSNVATVCADLVGVAAPYRHEVFRYAESGRNWDDTQLAGDFARAAGLAGEPLQDFQSCFADHATSRFVLETQQHKPEVITHTPAFTVNGNPADLQSVASSPSALLAAIQRAA